MIRAEMTIREVLERHPAAANVFGRYGVDFCCGGNHSVADAARHLGLPSVEVLLEELRVGGPTPGGRRGEGS